jgi:hypothetical protein
VDGGPNQILNGDFGAGLGHWRPWNERPGATSSLNTSDFRSSPNSYEWNVTASVLDSHIVYDTTDTSDPVYGPFHEGTTSWIPAAGGSAVEVHFWHRYGGVGVTLYVLFSGDADDMGEWWFDPQADWTEGVITTTLPINAVGVGIAFDYQHSERWTGALRINSSDNAIRGLQIVNFPGYGILLDGGAQNNTIGGDSTIGTALLGQGNLISGNGGDAVLIEGSGTTNNTISGNTIGLNVTGTSAWSNLGDGVDINSGPSHNTIGGDEQHHHWQLHWHGCDWH